MLQVDNFDQKPFHLCEAGSRAALTLDFKGAREISLKEIHSQTRARWTANTLCTSDKLRAAKGLHLEILFKGGDGVLRASEDFIRTEPVVASCGFPLSVATSDSGSYRLEHLLSYLEKSLVRGPGDDGRWRILMCDAYAPHFNEAIAKLAWQHRYVVIMIGGGATGVVQVNDTHLHGPLSKEYMSLEMAEAFAKLQADPDGCPGRTREQCITDLVILWRRAGLHLRASEGFKQNMLTSALTGSEDHLASSEVAAFWEQLKMSPHRSRIVDEVCSEYEAGRAEWDYEIVQAKIERFPVRGHLDTYAEGQEDEGGDADVPEAAWRDQEGSADGPYIPSPAGSDNEGARRPTRQRGTSVALDESQKKEVERTLAKIAVCDQAVASFAEKGEMGVCMQINKVRARVLKEGAGGSQVDSHVAQTVRRQELLSRDLDAQRMAREGERRRAHEAERKASATAMATLDARVKRLVEQEHRCAGSVAAAAAKSKRLALELAAKSFLAVDMGQGSLTAGGERHKKNRLEMMNRVFALGDEPSLEVQTDWTNWSHRFDDTGKKKHGMRWGSTLKSWMEELLQQLSEGDSGAALRFRAHYNTRWTLEQTSLACRLPGH